MIKNFQKTLTYAAIGLLLPSLAFAENPIAGTWYNSYCSRVDLSIDNNSGEISGVYTSHTGSTGSSVVKGYTNPAATVDNLSAPPTGIPFSLGVQWRLINVPMSGVDGSWHWVSTFSGQYHPEQTITAPNQNPYNIQETLEIFNGLYATASVPGLADKFQIPLFWPQTLRFHKIAPSYCMTTTPGTPVSYTPTATNHVTGKWADATGSVFDIVGDLGKGTITGTYTVQNEITYKVVGLFDTTAPSSSGEYETIGQGVTLSAFNDQNKLLKMFAGYIPYTLTTRLILWESDLKSTTWTDRFTQETLSSTAFQKQK